MLFLHRAQRKLVLFCSISIIPNSPLRVNDVNYCIVPSTQVKEFIYKYTFDRKKLKFVKYKRSLICVYNSHIYRLRYFYTFGSPIYTYDLFIIL